ncbi:hypothetical protein RhiirA5_429446 [Rhizophagus irregularis]|uniref:Uncharacterized protein n=1 Tax=Rhizophagus irregularis TaxID=588596 RepID=A0A2N0NYF4_9GLOM|nr:hypothetical protein RhiirA5_429446 [Rhizophagus irregularis]
MCSSPAINPKLPSSAPSKGHTATLVGNYMIIAFGSFYNGGKFVQSNQIYMIDVSDKNNFKWVKDFTPNSISETANNSIASVIIIVSNVYWKFRATSKINKVSGFLVHTGLEHRFFVHAGLLKGCQIFCTN